MYGYITFIGRLLLAALFFVSALGKISAPTMTQYFMSTYGIPFAEVLMWVSVVAELGGAVGLLLGWQALLAAFGLAMWLVPVTLIFHSNWSVLGQMQAFMGNIGLMGGLLFIAGMGAGAFSLDQRRKISVPKIGSNPQTTPA